MRKILLAFASVFLLGTSAAAAEILIEPSTGTFRVGEVVDIEVNLSTPDQPINGVSFTVEYPEDQLRFIELRKNTELVSFWIESDRNHSDGTVTLEGLLIDKGFQGEKENLAEITFQVIKDGSASVFLSQGAVHAYDGNGTNVLEFSSDSQLSFVGANTDGGQNVVKDILVTPQEESQFVLPLWASATIIGMAIILLLLLIALFTKRQRSVSFKSEADKEMFEIFMQQLKNRGGRI